MANDNVLSDPLDFRGDFHAGVDDSEKSVSGSVVRSSNEGQTQGVQQNKPPGTSPAPA